MRSRLPALQLEIEITEAVLIDDFEAAPDILRQIRATGVRVSLDAFDTGDPSFGDLRRFPFDRAKINPSWRVPTPSTTDKSIKPAMGTMARRLGMTIAEGVGTSGQADQLRQVGCQGWRGSSTAVPHRRRNSSG